MLSRIVVWLFYAFFFFALGSWTSAYTGGMRATLAKGAEIGWQGVKRLQVWAVGTISDTTGSGTTPVETKPKVSNTLANARNAFARGDISIAISAYEEYLKAQPDDIDARGELGNVLFGNGRLPEAAKAFHETALRLIAKGEAAKARQLVPAIRRGNPALASELDTRLAQDSIERK